MNPHWSAQDVERFREQQRWRCRQETIQRVLQFRPQQQQSVSSTTELLDQQQQRERTRKVSLKFRKEHQLFTANNTVTAPESQCERSRVAFPSARLPSRHRQEASTVSPVPHTSDVMFNAFDSSASPEAFMMERPRILPMGDHFDNQLEEVSSPPADDRAFQLSSCPQTRPPPHPQFHPHGSLWRRRFHEQRKSPKLGQVALWETAGLRGVASAMLGSLDNQLKERQPAWADKMELGVMSPQPMET
ncbi:hypothetical protein P43SY_004460 [Pythium insidiosum]|uniref:Uncharacterized protein n=1 Tax=Pythium insidiosum TaxID=114742 RepID=A0AAD5MG55_PYTIN|nr:hypothetical protein P43SY_004460 [Pythium insidiosum]